MIHFDIDLIIFMLCINSDLTMVLYYLHIWSKIMDKEYCLLGCNAMYSVRNLVVFQRNFRAEEAQPIHPPSFTIKMEAVLSSETLLSPSLHCVTSQKTVFFIVTAIRTSNLTWNCGYFECSVQLYCPGVKN